MLSATKLTSTRQAWRLEIVEPKNGCQNAAANGLRAACLKPHFLSKIWL
jgi:hypothetical protein